VDLPSGWERRFDAAKNKVCVLCLFVCVFVCLVHMCKC
jgi:hypothetical protein